MDDALKATYEKLKGYRTDTDLTIRASPFLKKTFTGFDGAEHPLSHRYYQVQGILHLFAMNRFLLGDDCGLGKTLQAITALCFIWEKQPDQKVIILTNKSAVGQWCKEFDKFCHSEKLTIIPCLGSPKKRTEAYGEFEAAEGPTVLVMGYATARQDIAQIQDWSDYIVIFDEATAFKNPKTQIYKVARHMSEKAAGVDRETAEFHTGRVWALTATLIKNHLLEGYGIYSVVVPGLLGKSRNKFINRYCVTRLQRIKGNRQIPIIVGYHPWAIPEFKELIDPYYLGRPKHEVAKELPPLTIKTRKVGLTKPQKLKYAEALDGLLEIDKTGEEKETTKLTALIYCQQIVDHLELIDCEGGSEKLDTLIDLLTSGDFEEENVIVYSRFRKMVDLMQPLLEKKGVKTVRITGAENDKQRMAAMEAFQNPTHEARVALITDAASEAINLQSAKAIIFYDSPWSAGNYLQILGRMIRIGSEHDRCYAIHLAAKGSIDEKVMGVLKKKMKLIEAVMGKRIKGEEDEVIVAAENDISDIFEAMKQDALSWLNT
jgi:SNF2 family DNA or RNA helicase